MLLSVDWDAFSGTRELVFDAPIWGSRDREHDRLDAWRERARKRGGGPGDWAALDADFPLYSGWQALEQYAGLPCFVTLSHADAWAWLQRFPGRDVLNVDSHHDLCSFSGERTRLRPGNWAGLGLAAGLVRRYTCAYPDWHAGLPVAEGFDLERTRAELAPLLSPELLGRVTLEQLTTSHSVFLASEDNANSERDGFVELRNREWSALNWPSLAQVEAVLLVQSPAWTNPAHDAALLDLAGALQATPIVPPMRR